MFLVTLRIETAREVLHGMLCKEEKAERKCYMECCVRRRRQRGSVTWNAV